MSRIRPIAWVILAVTVALLSWQLAQRKLAPKPSPAEELAGTPSESQNQSRSRPILKSGSNAPDQLVAPDALSAAPGIAHVAPSGTVPVPETSESSSLPAQTVLENMRTTIRQYASAFGENPVGTNPEITSVLQGANPKHINFLKQDGNRVNANGEMVDVWGTPYFFHQISGHEMEIRSAGPDRVMYTGDDLVIR